MVSVSTIIPTRNRPDLLVEALTSVADQDVADMEVIVVDDASVRPDLTLAVVKSFEDRLEVRCVALPERGGTGRARNEGIRRARGEFVALLDDDDLWHPGKLRRQLERFRENPRGLHHLGVVYVWHQWVDVKTGRTRVRQPRLEKLDDLFRWNYNIPQTILIRRDCFEKVGMFDEQMPTKQDFDLLARVIQHFAFDCVEEILVTCRDHPGPRRTDDFRDRLRGFETLLERYGPRVQDPRVLHDFWYRVGRLRWSAGDRARARREFREALRLAPIRYKARCFAFWALAHLYAPSRHARGADAAT